MGQIIFNNGITFAAGSVDLLNPELQALFDENIVSAEFPEGVIEAMGYKKTKVLNPHAKFSAKLGTPELDEVTENELLPELPTGKGADKGMAIKKFGDVIPTSRHMYNWLMAASPLAGADSSVKESYRAFAEDFRALRKAGIKKKNFEATKVLTQGWTATNPNGAGSPTNYGQALFASTQPFNRALSGVMGTFQNILGGSYGTADAALTETTLQLALDLHKEELKTYIGDRVGMPNTYILVVGRGLGTTARKILNTPGSDAGIYSGLGNNSMQLNQFSFNGNRVAILEHPVIGAYDKNGNQIGSDNMWFVLNAELANEEGALKHFELQSPEIDMWEDKRTKGLLVSYYEEYAFDHYGLEKYIVGSRGTA